MELNDKIIEKIYAGWLGKLIGIRSGAPIEMWTDEQIFQKYGELDGYPVNYTNFGADDDSNGNIFALETFFDNSAPRALTPVDFGKSILNYAPFEHGYFWWGGYGISMEHTAYLNMQNGLMPPESGSIRHNGKELAQQIGGQIFSDIYGLVCPSDYKKAADLAEKAAKVTHDGEALNGARFVGACISAAFTAESVEDMVKCGLSVIPKNSVYRKTVEDIAEFYKSHSKESFRVCLEYIKKNYWKDKFGGNCHIIPNAAIMALALNYGEGNFDRTVNICNMCGFDTDCNTSNLGAMLGALYGLKAINYDKWRLPINDVTVASSVNGYKNIVDAPSFALKLARAAEMLSENGQKFTGHYANFIESGCFNFELPGSTHGFVSKTALLSNTVETAATGRGSLKITAAEGVNKIFRKTYYRAAEMYDNRYDPAFSPQAYCGQTLSVFVAGKGKAALYAYDINSDTVFKSEFTELSGGFKKLTFKIPVGLNGELISEVGIITENAQNDIIYMDDFIVNGQPSYVLDFSKERMEYYTLQHQEISQCTYSKGYWRLEDGMLSGSCATDGELYTGGNFNNVKIKALIIPVNGRCHNVLFNVSGAMRSYGAGFDGQNLVIVKKDFKRVTLASMPFNWEHGKEYAICISVNGGEITVLCDGKVLKYNDLKPFVGGQTGIAVRENSRCNVKRLEINL